MLVQINKKLYAKIYFKQIDGSLLLNGRKQEPKTIKLKTFINFLKSLSISINIIYNQDNNERIKNIKNKKIIFTDKLLFKLSNIILDINNKNILKKNNHINNNISFKLKFDNFKNAIFAKSSILIILLFLFFILIFLYDYKSIEAKINQINNYEIKNIETEFDINKCNEHGDLTSLKKPCKLMKEKIELLKTKKPSLISVFFIWLLDIINSYFTTFNLNNCFITIIFLFIIFKLFK